MDFYQNWLEEKRSAHLYNIMAEHEKNMLHKKLFLDLKAAAEKQADLWAAKITAEGKTMPVYTPDLRTRLVSRLVKLLGTETLHSVLSAMKIRGMSVFNRYHNEHK